MLRAVLFDLGGVIVTSPFDEFAAYERRRGLPPGFLRRVNATDPHTNAWARLERAELSVEDFDVAFAEESAALGHRVPGADLLDLLRGEVRPEVAAAVRGLVGRYRLGLLTNNVVEPEGAPARPDLDDVLTCFDVVVESSKAGVRKPEPRFYELACEALDIEPHEAVFLDDLGINLKPARAMGMATIKVVDPAVALAELDRLLAEPG